jgi:hypothetical protein
MHHFDKKLSLQMLHELTCILDKHNIKYWLQDGTLLGYYREGNLISHDNDTDIGLFWSDIKSKDVFLEILQNDFKLVKIKGFKENSLMLTFTKSLQKVDLFFYYKDENKIYHTALGKNWEVVSYSYDPFNVKLINFLGYDFKVPEDELKFIETKYGLDWKTPKVIWDNINGPVNAYPTGVYLDIKKCKKEFRTWLKK